MCRRRKSMSSSQPGDLANATDESSRYRFRNQNRAGHLAARRPDTPRLLQMSVKTIQRNAAYTGCCTTEDTFQSFATVSWIPPDSFSLKHEHLRCSSYLGCCAVESELRITHPEVF